VEGSGLKGLRCEGVSVRLRGGLSLRVEWCGWGVGLCHGRWLGREGLVLSKVVRVVEIQMSGWGFKAW